MICIVHCMCTHIHCCMANVYTLDIVRRLLRFWVRVEAPTRTPTSSLRGRRVPTHTTTTLSILLTQGNDHKTSSEMLVSQSIWQLQPKLMVERKVHWAKKNVASETQHRTFQPTPHSVYSRRRLTAWNVLWCLSHTMFCHSINFQPSSLT